MVSGGVHVIIIAAAIVIARISEAKDTPLKAWFLSVADLAAKRRTSAHGGDAPVRKGKDKESKDGGKPEQAGANNIGYGTKKAGVDELLEWRMVRLVEEPELAMGLQTHDVAPTVTTTGILIACPQTRYTIYKFQVASLPLE